MTHEQFSTQERWCEISDFPGYLVSDQGRVMHQESERLVTPTAKSQGLMMVGLMGNKDDGSRCQFKRSLPLLVARAFLPPPPAHFRDFDTPIHLDGDRSNNRVTNLTWRPLWFARLYGKQFHDGHTTYDGPVEDVETHILYKSTMDAAVTHGLLDSEIMLSMHDRTHGYVWPTGQIFRKAV